jgi:hypothetical protein
MTWSLLLLESGSIKTLFKEEKISQDSTYLIELACSLSSQLPSFLLTSFSLTIDYFPRWLGEHYRRTPPCKPLLPLCSTHREQYMFVPSWPPPCLFSKHRFNFFSWSYLCFCSFGMGGAWGGRCRRRIRSDGRHQKLNGFVRKERLFKKENVSAYSRMKTYFWWIEIVIETATDESYCNIANKPMRCDGKRKI